MGLKCPMILTGSNGLGLASVNFKKWIQPVWLLFAIFFLTNKIFIDLHFLKSQLKMYFLKRNIFSLQDGS